MCYAHMMVNVGASFNFHHKRILNLAVVSRFTSNAELAIAMISFFFEIGDLVYFIYTKLKLNTCVKVVDN